MRVLFLPDFGAEIGGGHVMRCLTLAGEFTARGAECGFCVLPDAIPVIQAFVGDRFPFVDRSWAAPIAVLDGYNYSADHERALAAEGRIVAAVDDLMRPHDCDLVTDSGLGRRVEDYPGRARVLPGPVYALLRPEFAQAREEALARREAGGGRVLVSLGLTDVGGITERVLRLMLHVPGWTGADVILGTVAPSLEYVQTLAARDPRIVLHVNTKDMAGLTTRADLAVGAGGVGLWERAALGLPGIALILAENQAKTSRLLEELGAGLAFDVADAAFDEKFTRGFSRLVADRALRAAITDASSRLCDGCGASRVVDAILDLAGQGESARP